MSGRLDSDVRRLEGRLDAAERLSEARLDTRFARLEVSLERILHAQTDALRDLTTKLEFLGARQAGGEAAARGLAAQLEATRAEGSEDRRAARRRHIQVIAAIIGAALAMTAALIGLGPFGVGAVQIGATSPTPRPEEAAVTPREQAAAQGPVQGAPPAPEEAAVTPREQTAAQGPVQGAPPAPARAPTPVRPPPPDQPEQATVQAPVPLPSAPQAVEQAVSRVDLAAVSAAVAAAADCGLVASASSADGVSVSGVVRRSEEATVMGMLNAFGGASATSRISLQPFDGPYCAALAAMRLDVAAPEAAPHLSLVSPNPLPNGQRLQFRVEVPVWASRLHVTYLTVSGDAGHLVNGAAVRPGETLIFNDPRWIATEPFGTDLLVAVASDRPLFAQKRRNVERQADYALALTAALRAVQEKGGRAAVRVIVVETAAH
jgi:serine/threonine-protein kinase